MEYLSSGMVLVIDLAASDVSEEELDESLVAEKIGGAGITTALYEQYKDEDPIVLGTGLLTGTLFPASALGIITAKSPVTGKVSHSPITLAAGMEMKYTGFDYIVIKGKAENPVFLWIHDGVADIEDGSAIWGKDVWETTDHLRKAMGDDLIQTLVIGKAGEDGSDLAQVCVNYWANGDRFGFGKLFGEKNVKGVALRGMGLLEIADPEEFVDKCFDLLGAVKGGAWVGKKGLLEVAAALGEDIESWLGPIVHRHHSCYNTPYATNTFVYLDEDPKLTTETLNAEPGFMINDLPALLELKKAGLSAADAGKVLKACAKYGIDGAAVAELSQKEGKTSADDIINGLSSFKGAASIAGEGKFSPWCPQKPVFGDFGSADAKWWERRQAVSYIFGIHPLFAIMSPELTEESMLELTAIGTELEMTPELLDEVVAYVCA